MYAYIYHIIREMCLGSVLGQTLMKAKHNKMKWTVRFVQTWNLLPPLHPFPQYNSAHGKAG